MNNEERTELSRSMYDAAKQPLFTTGHIENDRVRAAVDAIKSLDWDVDEVGFYPTVEDVARAALNAADQKAHPDLTTAYMAGVAKGEERVERAADAIRDYLANSNDLDEIIGEVELLIAARESAKVALDAAGSDPDFDLDAAPVEKREGDEQ